MKKKRGTMLLLCTVLLFGTGCGKPAEVREPEVQETAGAETPGVTVDEGMFDVTITMPAIMFEGEDINVQAAEMKESGMKEVTVNADGSVTATMSKRKHRELLDGMTGEILKSFEEMASGVDFPSIKAIQHRPDFSEVTMEVDQSAFENSFDTFAVMGVGMSAMMYQVFDGVEGDDLSVLIHLKDAASGKEFDTVVFPDDLDQ